MSRCPLNILYWSGFSVAQRLAMADLSRNGCMKSSQNPRKRRAQGLEPLLSRQRQQPSHSTELVWWGYRQGSQQRRGSCHHRAPALDSGCCYHQQPSHDGAWRYDLAVAVTTARKVSLRFLLLGLIVPSSKSLVCASDYQSVEHGHCPSSGDSGKASHWHFQILLEGRFYLPAINHKVRILQIYKWVSEARRGKVRRKNSYYFFLATKCLSPIWCALLGNKFVELFCMF